MKKLASLTLSLVIALSLITGTFTVTEAKSLSTLTKVPLNYMDSDNDWKVATSTTRTSPVAFQGNLNSANFTEDTKQFGGNPEDPISAAKAPDDVYLKLENLPKQAQTDNYVEIITAKTPTVDRWVLAAGDANVITISMDFATSNVNTGDSKNLFACETNASTTSTKNNKWEPAAGVSTAGKFGSGTIANNTWYNVTCEIGGSDAKAVKYFLNGEQVGTQTLTNANLGLVRTGAQAKKETYNVDTIYYDNVYVNVGEPYTMARYHANRDASDLNFLNFKGENTDKENITKNLVLTSYYEGMDEETSISWSSDSETVNPQTGEVIRDAVDRNVTLTATITNGAASNTKNFNLFVPARAVDAEEIINAKNALSTLISANEEKTSEEYTESSYETFSSAMTAAQEAVNSSDVSFSDLFNAKNALIAAVDGLDITTGVVYGVITQDANTQKDKTDNFNTDLIVVKSGYGELYGNTSRMGYIGINASAIPDGAGKVYLKLYATKAIAPQASPLSLYETGAFDETTIKYSNRPATGNLISTTTNAGVESAAGWITFDVTDYTLREKANGVNDIYFAFTTADSDNVMHTFASKEYSDENLRPVFAAENINLGRSKDVDLNAIDINALINDNSVDTITKDLKELPTIGSKYNHRITWTSSNPEIISETGKVTLPAETTAVTLTASINEDGVVHSRTYELTVRVFNNEESDANDLTFDKIKGNNTVETAVTSKLNLITEGTLGTPITWSSSDEEIVANDGTVTRDAVANAKDVTLTATVGTGENAVVKEFDIRVYGDVYVYDEADPSVPVYMTSGITITTETTWRITGYSHNANGLTNQYLVYKASEGMNFSVETVTASKDKSVTFETSTDNINWTSFTNVDAVDSIREIGTHGGHNDKVYTSTTGLPAGTKYLKVIAPDVDRAWKHRITSVKIYDNSDELSFEAIKGDNIAPDCIVGNLTLVDSFNGSSIVWSNNGSEIISADGTMAARPAVDTPVKLTAEITKDGVTTVKVYNLTAKAYADTLATTDIPFVYYIGGTGGTQIVAVNNSKTVGKGTKLYSSVDILNITAEPKDTAIVIAVYSADGVLLDVKYDKITVDTAAAPQKKVTELTLSNETEGIYSASTVKSFV